LDYLTDFLPEVKIAYQQGKINIPADLQSRRADYEAVEKLPEAARKLPEADGKLPPQAPGQQATTTTST